MTILQWILFVVTESIGIGVMSFAGYVGIKNWRENIMTKKIKLKRGIR